MYPVAVHEARAGLPVIEESVERRSPKAWSGAVTGA